MNIDDNKSTPPEPKAQAYVRDRLPLVAAEDPQFSEFEQIIQTLLFVPDKQ